MTRRFNLNVFLKLTLRIQQNRIKTKKNLVNLFRQKKSIWADWYENKINKKIKWFENIIAWNKMIVENLFQIKLNKHYVFVKTTYIVFWYNNNFVKVNLFLK